MKLSSFLARLRIAAIGAALLIPTHAQGQNTVKVTSSGQPNALKVTSTSQDAETSFASEWVPEKRRDSPMYAYGGDEDDEDDEDGAMATNKDPLGFEPAPYHNDFNGIQIDSSCNNETKSQLSDIFDYIREAVTNFRSLLDKNEETGKPYVYDVIPKGQFVHEITGEPYVFDGIRKEEIVNKKTGEPYVYDFIPIGQIINDMLQIINGESNTIPVFCATAESNYCTFFFNPSIRPADPMGQFFWRLGSDGGDSLALCPSSVPTINFDGCSHHDYFKQRVLMCSWVKFLAFLSISIHPTMVDKHYSRRQKIALARHIAVWVHMAWHVSDKKPSCPGQIHNTDLKGLLSLSEPIAEAKSAICGNRCRSDRECKTALTGCRCRLSIGSNSSGDSGGGSSSAAVAYRCLPP